MRSPAPETQTVSPSFLSESRGTELKLQTETPITPFSSLRRALELGDESQTEHQKSLSRLGSLSPRSRQGWLPLYLRPYALLGFAAAYTSHVALLAGLYQYSQSHQGLAKFHENWHYIFKYSPTAVLTVFAAFWAQIEYRTKQSAPWNAMAKGWVPARQSLLLDYISDWNVLVFPRALISKHFAVALSIFGSLLVKILIVTSTGLFTSQEVSVRRQSNLPSEIFSVPAGFEGSHVDVLPVLNIQHVVETGSSYPLGSTPEHTFQPFSIPAGTNLSHLSISSIVDVFSFNLNCQISQNSSFYNFTGSASTPGCDVTWDTQLTGPTGPILYLQTIGCENNNEVVSGEFGQRLLICAMNPEGDTYLVYSNPTTCLLCLPSYSIVPGNVTMAGSNVTSIELMQNATRRQVPGLSSWQVGLSVFQALGTTGPRNYLGEGAAPNNGYANNFQSILEALFPLATSSEIFNAEFLYNASSSTLSQVAAQVALLHFMSVKNDSEVQVQYQALETRLTVQAEIFIAMEVMLCILIVISILLAFAVSRRRVVSRDPSTLLGLAAILARSADIVLMPNSGFEQHVSHASYSTTAIGSNSPKLFSILVNEVEVEDNQKALDEPTLNANSASKSWSPFPMTQIGRALLFTMPIILICLLSGLLSKSTSSQGILSLPENVLVLHYGWTLVPAAVLFCVVMQIDALDTSISLLQPFHALSDRCTRLKRDSIYGEDYTRLVAPHRLWYALKHRDIAMVASTSAAICAGFLTIVVSGLFSPGVAVFHYTEIPARTTGWFDSVNVIVPGFYGDVNNSDQYATTRIEYLNASFPQWSYSELALAEIDLQLESGASTGVPDITAGSTTLDIEVPALRGRMNCSTHPYASARPIFQNLTSYGTGNFLEVNMSFAETCATSEFLTLTYWNFNDGMLSTIWLRGDEAGVIGYWTPPIFNNPPGYCPTTMGIFADLDSDGTPKNVTILTCKPYVEAVQAKATFDLPSFNLISTSEGVPPVIALEDTAAFFSNDSFFGMDFADHDEYGMDVFETVLLSVNLSTPSPLAASDGFFQALFQGTNAIPDPHSLLGPTNSNKLIAAVEHLYSIVMAQCLINGRRLNASPVNASFPQPQSGNITTRNERRLYQSPTATYILITLLATILLCSIVATYTLKPEGLLTQSPNSIAARAELLAGSRLLQIMPDGAEWCTDEDFRHSGIFEGMALRLGRWDTDTTGGTRYGVDVFDVTLVQRKA